MSDDQRLGVMDDIVFCCKAFYSEKSTRLRTELVSWTFPVSINSGLWQHVNGKLLFSS